MSRNTFRVPTGYYYHPEHSWAKIEGNKALVGVTDYIQTYVGQVISASLTDVGEQIDAGLEFSRLNSEDQDVSFISPLTGDVIKANLEAVEKPFLINDDCYLMWLIELELSDLQEIDDLMSPSDYQEFLFDLGT